MTQLGALAEQQAARRTETGDPLPVVSEQRLRGGGSAFRLAACSSWSRQRASDPLVGQGDLRRRARHAVATDKLRETCRGEHRFSLRAERVRRLVRLLRVVDSRALHSAVNSHTRVEAGYMRRLWCREGRPVPCRRDPCLQSLRMCLISAALPFWRSRLKPNCWAASRSGRTVAGVSPTNSSTASGPPKGRPWGPAPGVVGSVLSHCAGVDSMRSRVQGCRLTVGRCRAARDSENPGMFGDLLPSTQSWVGSSTFGVDRPAEDRAPARKHNGSFSA